MSSSNITLPTQHTYCQIVHPHVKTPGLPSQCGGGGSYSLGKPLNTELCSSWIKQNKTSVRNLWGGERRSNALSLSNLLCPVLKDHFPSVSHRDRWPGPASENKCCGDGWLSGSCWAASMRPTDLLGCTAGLRLESAGLFFPSSSEPSGALRWKLCVLSSL